MADRVGEVAAFNLSPKTLEIRRSHSRCVASYVLVERTENPHTDTVQIAIKLPVMGNPLRQACVPIAHLALDYITVSQQVSATHPPDRWQQGSALNNWG